jgi:anti-anti-sigma factor
MLQIAPGWDLEVERGPDWLFVRVRCAPEQAWAVPPLADAVWQLLEQHMTYRVVLECDEINLLHSTLVAELVSLSRRIKQQGGMMRLSGMSPENRQVLNRCQLDTFFPHNCDRNAAVMGDWSQKPR